MCLTHHPSTELGVARRPWRGIILSAHRGCSSVVEHLLAKEDVASSSLVTRSSVPLIAAKGEGERYFQSADRRALSRGGRPRCRRPNIWDTHFDPFDCAQGKLARVSPGTDQWDL
jgi:hypothetical protein